jgi:hypothetical protein
MTTTDKLATCRQRDNARAYVAAFELHTKGMKHLSSGICSTCCYCQSTYGMDAGELERAIDNGLSDEGGFSRAGCDCCGSLTGQNLYDGHCWIELDGKERLEHVDMCEDCLIYIANGDLPLRGEN